MDESRISWRKNYNESFVFEKELLHLNVPLSALLEIFSVLNFFSAQSAHWVGGSQKRNFWGMGKGMKFLCIFLDLLNYLEATLWGKFPNFLWCASLIRLFRF